MKKIISMVAITLAVISMTAATTTKSTTVRGMVVNCGNGKMWELSFNQDVAIETCDEIALIVYDYFCFL